jgi:hypothetical protein
MLDWLINIIVSRYRILLFMFLILGMGLIFIPLRFGVDYYGIPPELGKALIVAFVLGITIEPWMRKAIAKDVFSAAFGYYMPQDFKDQIARIASHRIICTKHIMDVRIKELNSDEVQIIVTVERHFENIDTLPKLHRAMTWVDEWGSQQPSKITRCEIFGKSGVRSKKFEPRRIEYLPNLSFRATSPRMILFPKDTVGTIIEYSVVRRRNDFIYEQFMTPTRNPEIRILEQPDSITVVAESGIPSTEMLKLTHIAGRYELDSVYFPPSPMKVRWWPKAASEKWPPPALDTSTSQPDLRAGSGQ